VRNPTVKFREDAGKIWQMLYEHSYLDEEKLLKITKLTDREFHAGVGWLAREDKIAKKINMVVLKRLKRHAVSAAVRYH